MTAPGMSDSFGGVSIAPKACPRCGASLTVNGGDCLNCLLQVGLEDEEIDAGESFGAVLAELDVRDTEWRLGNYQILEEIGRGGMGVIYRARQRHSKRIVALKRVLSYHGDSHETLERFRREAEAVASLDHPNILPIYEVGEADGLPFFTMKLATGGSLQHAAATLRRDPRECVRLIAKVARGVAHAHRQGILHRDLKPGNILLDSRGEPLVSDFGLAKWMDGNTDLTRSLAIFGTPGFIAPEQAGGLSAALTPAADVYSLGAILFDLLTGRAPFLGEHAIAVIHQAAEKPAPKLRAINDAIERDLETICAKCLEREPPGRYRSAADLAEDLERWLEGRAIVARPLSPPMRMWRWSRRNPLVAITTAACVAAAGVAATRQVQSWRLQTQVTAQLAAERSVQVLPILDLDTGLPDVELTRALAAELKHTLDQLGPVTVELASLPLPAGEMPAQDAQPRQPSRTLLSGTVREVDGARRVSLHLLEASERRALLPRISFVLGGGNGGVADAAVAQQIYAVLSAADLERVVHRTVDPGLLDPEARNFLDVASELSNRRGGLDFDRAIGCIRHALELQPQSSAAHAALAKTLAMKAGFSSTHEPLKEAMVVARRAVALDPQNADARIALAAVLSLSHRLKESLEESLTSLEYAPISARIGMVGNLYRAMGRPDLALRWHRIREQNLRLPGEMDAAKADCHVSLLEDERAEAGYQRYLKLHPEQPDGWMGLCYLRLLNGRMDEARQIYQQYWNGYADFSYAVQMAAQVEFFARNFFEAEKLYSQLEARDAGGGGSFYGRVSYASALGRIMLQSNPELARERLEGAKRAELQLLSSSDEDSSVAYRLAAIEATLGEKAAALRHLRVAARRGWIDFRSAIVDPRFDAIRTEPEFNDIIHEVRTRVTELSTASLPQ